MGFWGLGLRFREPPLEPAEGIVRLLGGSGDLVSKGISTPLGGGISIVTLFVTLITNSHDPVSRLRPPTNQGFGGEASEALTLGRKNWLTNVGT